MAITTSGSLSSDQPHSSQMTDQVSTKVVLVDVALQLAGDGSLLVERRAVVAHAHARVTGATWQDLLAVAQHDPQVGGGGAIHF
jgi:hypothetical protein